MKDIIGKKCILKTAAIEQENQKPLNGRIARVVSVDGENVVVAIAPQWKNIEALLSECDFEAFARFENQIQSAGKKILKGLIQ
ncbi:MAG TPA: hypothetical protein PLI53_08640 [Geobacteraceae bacterium]|nr:hypothetical protein [Geobacteraceae bacterium]